MMKPENNTASIDTPRKRSRHNLYRPEITNLNIRLTQEQRRKVEIEAAERGVSIVSFVRSLIDKATRRTRLTEADKRIIAERTAENVARQNGDAE